jgi:hypothetical protein
VLGVVEAETGDGAVEAAVLEGKRGGVAFRELDVGETGGSRLAPCRLDHRRRDVDASDRVHTTGELPRDQAGSAGHIDPLRLGIHRDELEESAAAELIAALRANDSDWYVNSSRIDSSYTTALLGTWGGFSAPTGGG